MTDSVTIVNIDGQDVMTDIVTADRENGLNVPKENGSEAVIIAEMGF